MPNRFEALTPEARVLFHKLFCDIGYVYNDAENSFISPLTALNRIKEIITPYWKELIKANGGDYASVP